MTFCKWKRTGWWCICPHACHDLCSVHHLNCIIWSNPFHCFWCGDSYVCYFIAVCLIQRDTNKVVVVVVVDNMLWNRCLTYRRVACILTEPHIELYKQHFGRVPLHGLGNCLECNALFKLHIGQVGMLMLTIWTFSKQAAKNMHTPWYIPYIYTQTHASQIDDRYIHTIW